MAVQSAHAESVQPPPTNPEASSKASFKDGLGPAAKGNAPSKRKSCCGYPLVADGEWALRFYWIAEQENFEHDHDEEHVYTRDGMFIGAFPARFIKALKME